MPEAFGPTRMNEIPITVNICERPYKLMVDPADEPFLFQLLHNQPDRRVTGQNLRGQFLLGLHLAIPRRKLFPHPFKNEPACLFKQTFIHACHGILLKVLIYSIISLA